MQSLLELTEYNTMPHDSPEGPFGDKGAPTQTRASAAASAALSPNELYKPGNVPGVIQCYAQVMRDLCEQGMAKSNRNSQQGFNFRGIDQVYGVLTPAMAAHGCILVPSIENIESWTGVTGKGSTMYYCRAHVRYTMYCLADGTSLSWVYVGEGADMGDKATSKALSMAYKYMAIHSFAIPVEAASIDDGDASTPEPTVSKPSGKGAKASKQPTAEAAGGVSVDDLVALIASSPTMDDLSSAYRDAVRSARNRNQPEWEASLTAAKDKRKAELAPNL